MLTRLSAIRPAMGGRCFKHPKTDARQFSQCAAFPSHSFSLEVRMTWSAGIRKFHRYVAILFTLTVITNFVAMAMGKPPSWIVY